MSDTDSSEVDSNSDIFVEDVTLGKLSDFETVIWQFPDTNKCPLSECGLSCSKRDIALAHFHLNHADTSMVCSICNELFSVVNPLKLFVHYQTQHPNERPPKLKSIEVNNKSVEDDKKDDKEDDCITLNGCGKITYWKFPENQKHCPNLSCNQKFGSRSAAIQHYKEQHAKHAILCYLCEKPISAKYSAKNFKKHYRRKHPNDDMPFSFDERRMRGQNQEAQHNKMNEDLITLEGCDQITHWRVPENLTRCPVHNCRKSFMDRSALIVHYKKQHAKTSIHCSICIKPISAVNKFDFYKHYRNRHSNVKNPFEHNQSLIDSQNDVHQTKKGEEDDLIELSGCGQITHWQFPRHLTQCPMQLCRMQFNVRSTLIEHYKKEHAINSIFCTICNKPIRVKVPNHFIEHHRRMHPNVNVPFDFDEIKNESERQIPQAKPVNEVDVTLQDDDTDDEEDYMITLIGCGQMTQWHVPKYLTKCPVKGCGLQFGVRWDLVVHYKKRHSMNAVLCSICDKPVITKCTYDFVRHYRGCHPNVPIPIDFHEINDQTTPTSQAKDVHSTNLPGDTNQSEEDMITLYGCGQITKWRFPKNKAQCPVRNCRMQFKLRIDAIDHYKNQHANGSILCTICNKPIRTQHSAEFKRHYKRKHPNKKIPYEFYAEKRQNQSKKVSAIKNVGNDDEEDDLIRLQVHGQITYWRFPKNQTYCPVHTCPARFGVRSDAIAHYKSQHAIGSILCPICQKPIRTTKNPGAFVKHYTNLHPHMKIPYNFETRKTPEQSESVASVLQDTMDVDDEDDEVDDLIKLMGCGQSTYWRFPKNQTHCPVHNCRARFGVRSDAIAHYKKRHAKSAIFCSLCNKPITARNFGDFNLHNMRKHPHVNHHDNSRKSTSVRSVLQTDSESKTTNQHDDLITLRGGGKITYWQFPPNLTRCPIHLCQKECADRLAAIEHYKQMHAQHSILCALCNKPISNANNFKTHFRNVHPNVEPPLESTVLNATSKPKFKAKRMTMNRCKICAKSFITPIILKRHLNEMHSSQRIRCPLMDCTFETKRMYLLHTHWQFMHKELTFPVFRDETNYIADYGNETNSPQPSTSKPSNDMESNSNVEPNETEDIDDPQNACDLDDNLLTPIHTVSVSSGESFDEYTIPTRLARSKWSTSDNSPSSYDETSEFEGPRSSKRFRGKYRRHLRSNPNKKRRNNTSSSGSSSGTSDSSDYVKSENEALGKRKVARKRTGGSWYSNNSNKPEDSERNKISVDMLPQCTVVLERINDSDETGKRSPSPNLIDVDPLEFVSIGVDPFDPLNPLDDTMKAESEEGQQISIPLEDSYANHFSDGIAMNSTAMINNVRSDFEETSHVRSMGVLMISRNAILNSPNHN